MCVTVCVSVCLSVCYHLAKNDQAGGPETYVQPEAIYNYRTIIVHTLYGMLWSC